MFDARDLKTQRLKPRHANADAARAGAEIRWKRRCQRRFLFAAPQTIGELRPSSS
jgi:hypothetical protein